MGGKFDETVGLHRSHPSAVEFNGGLLWVQNLENLSLVGLGVVFHLCLGKDLPRFLDSCRIADRPGKVADQKNDVMAKILEMFELVNKDGMAEM